MSSSTLLKGFEIIIAVIIAILAARVGISYMVILLALGFIMTLLTKSKGVGTTSGAAYALISYIISYPAGLLLTDYMPTTNITVETSAGSMMFNLVMGTLIPIIAAVIISGVAAIVAGYILGLFHRNNKDKEEKHEEHHYKVVNDFNEIRQRNKQQRRKKEEAIYMTPIQKAKIRREKEREKR